MRLQAPTSFGTANRWQLALKPRQKPFGGAARKDQGSLALPNGLRPFTFFLRFFFLIHFAVQLRVTISVAGLYEKKKLVRAHGISTASAS